MNRWEIAILRIIKSRDNYANTKEIYSDLESGIFMSLDDNHLRKTTYGGRPAYKHQVRSHLSNLVQSGDLVRVSKGAYSLTESGRFRADHEQ